MLAEAHPSPQRGGLWKYTDGSRPQPCAHAMLAAFSRGGDGCRCHGAEGSEAEGQILFLELAHHRSWSFSAQFRWVTSSPVYGKWRLFCFLLMLRGRCVGVGVAILHHVSLHKFPGPLLFCDKNSYLFVDLDEGTLWRMMSPASQILRSV